MLFMIVGGLIGAVLGYLSVAAMGFHMDLPNYMFAALITLVGGGLGVGAGFGIAYGIGKLLPKEWFFNYENELVAINDTMGIQGTFFLGTGAVGSEPIYTFYHKSGKGVKFGSVSAYKATVYEEEKRKEGVLRAYYKDFAKSFFKIIGFGDDERYYEIFVPAGSVKREFNLDLK